MLNKYIEVGKLQIQIVSWKVNMPHSVYMWGSMRCMPAGLCRLHHYITAWPAVRSAWGLLFYITAIPISSLLLFALLWLCPHITSSPRSPHFHICSCGFLCQPFLPSHFYQLTNAVRWSRLPCTLHRQAACSHHSPLKKTTKRKHHSTTVTHVCMKLNTCGNDGQWNTYSGTKTPI